MPPLQSQPNKMSENERFFKLAAMQIGAGGSAGFVEISIMHPLDLFKTRLQLQTLSTKLVKADDPHNYRGIIDCVKKMYRHEGLFSYWKGIIPPVLVETPKRAVKFLTFEQYKKFFMFGSSKPTALTYYCSGLGAGITEGLLVNPFEVVKVTLQANKDQTGKGPGTWSVTRLIIREHGFGNKGLYKGLTATLFRNGVFNMVYFGFYHTVKGLITESSNPYLEFLRKVAIGFTAGTLASCANIPFDVAKSRIQGPQPEPGLVKYHGMVRTLAMVYKEEGVFALYKGLLPKVLRLGPGGAVMLVTYDYVYNFLTKKFNIEPDFH